MIINQIIHIDMKKYSTNLTENQWEIIKIFLTMNENVNTI